MHYSPLPSFWLPSLHLLVPETHHHGYVLYMPGQSSRVGTRVGSDLFPPGRASLRMRMVRSTSTRSPSSRLSLRSPRDSSSSTPTSLVRRMWRWSRTLAGWVFVCVLWRSPLPWWCPSVALIAGVFNAKMCFKVKAFDCLFQTNEVFYELHYQYNTSKNNISMSNKTNVYISIGEPKGPGL